jgi:hypothetical protein
LAPKAVGSRELVQGGTECFKLFRRAIHILMPINAPPRFKIGDRIEVIASGDYKGKGGVVIEIVAGDCVFHYRVRLTDGSSETFFGFELESSDES